MRMMPLENRDPVPSGAGASPAALHDSVPTPASIARDSRASITVHSVEVQGGRFVVFRRFTGLLLGRPLRRGHTPLLGIHRRIGFLFRQGIGSRWDSIWRRRELNPRGSRRKGLVPGDECPAMRFRPAIGDEVCRSRFLGQLPIARPPTRPYPPEARTMATIPARTAAGRRWQTATTSARSGGTALDFALGRCCTPGPLLGKPGTLTSCPLLPSGGGTSAGKVGVRDEGHQPTAFRRLLRRRSGGLGAGRCVWARGLTHAPHQRHGGRWRGVGRRQRHPPLPCR